MSRKKIGLIEIVALPVLNTEFIPHGDYADTFEPILATIEHDEDRNFYFAKWWEVGIEALGLDLRDAIDHLQNKIRRIFMHLSYLEEAKMISEGELKMLTMMKRNIAMVEISDIEEHNQKYIDSLNKKAIDEIAYLN